MAERRMFAKTIVMSDAFLDMPLSARCLYFTFGMLADDDGFINSPKSIMRQIGASQDDLNVLMLKKFIIPFESGVVVIKHWKIHNYIQSDRYKETAYKEEKAKLTVKGNKAYKLTNTPCIQDVYSMDTQVRLGKDSIGKVSIDKSMAAKPPTHTRGKYGFVKLTDTEYTNLIKDLGEAEAQRVIAYIDESAATTGNKNKWKNWNLVLRKAAREGWGKKGIKKPDVKCNFTSTRQYSGLDYEGIGKDLLEG